MPARAVRRQRLGGRYSAWRSESVRFTAITTTTPTNSSTPTIPAATPAATRSAPTPSTTSGPTNSSQELPTRKSYRKVQEPADVPHRSAPRAGSIAVPEARARARRDASMRRASRIATSPTTA